MNNTRKNKIVCYTGIDSKKDGKHSIEEFRKITRKRCKSLVTCTKDADDNELMKNFGAKYTTPEECNDIVKGNKKADILFKKSSIANKAYLKCKTRKCSKIYKELNKEEKVYFKERNKACPKKLNLKCMADYYDKYYDKSKYKTLSDKYDKCGKKECHKEFKNYNKTFKKIMRLFK